MGRSTSRASRRARGSLHADVWKTLAIAFGSIVVRSSLLATVLYLNAQLPIVLED